MKKKPGSQIKLRKNVLEQSLCTGCGACVGLCPYQVIFHDRTVQLFDCDLPDGKCYAFCPRTPADYERIRRSLFNADDWTPEIGAVKGYYLSRAGNSDLRLGTQHGGTVTALLQLAMGEGMIDAAVVASHNGGLEQEGKRIDDPALLQSYARSRFTVSPNVAAFHQLPENDLRAVGIVATPCQALALARIKTADVKEYRKVDQLKLVIGLFCGWTLEVEKFQRLLRQHAVSAESIIGMDIPAGKNVLELKTIQGLTNVPMAEIDACVREACRYCMDSTAEFADLSVGAARYGGDAEEMRGWNQVIVRSASGQDLIDLARKKGILEIREAPVQALQELKNAAVEKKKKALKNIVGKSRSAKNLLYLKNDDPVAKKYLK